MMKTTSQRVDEYTLKEAQERFERIKRILSDDVRHDKKRLLSFTILDNLLTKCEQGICPSVSSEDHQFLTDISIDCYIHQRSYYYSIDGLGSDDTERWNWATKRVQGIFNCTKPPALDEAVFNSDLDSTTWKWHPSYRGARVRKAYWSYMANKNSCCEADYYAAEKFINFLAQVNSEKKHTSLNLAGNSLSSFWTKNSHITNGLDLFRYCLARKRK